MENIEELNNIEREFEDLQDLIKQQLDSLQELSNIQTQFYALKHAQEYNQITSQSTIENVSRVENSQRRLVESFGDLESRIQNLNNQFSQSNQKFTQKLEEIASQSPSKEFMEDKIEELEARFSLQLKEEIKHLSRNNAEFVNRLEIQFNRVNSFLKQDNEKTTSLITISFIFMLGFLAILFIFL